MNLRPLLALSKVSFVALILVAMGTFSRAHAATFTIDLFTTTQFVSAFNDTGTSTVAEPGAVGGFRTMSLSSSDNDDFNSALAVNSAFNRMSLAAPEGAIANYSLLYGGAGGVAGLGGVNVTSGNPVLTQSAVTFALRSADFPSAFTWTFTDSLANTATYVGAFPSKSSMTSPLVFSIPLASFSNAGAVNWTSINFIQLAGGGVSSLDLTLLGPLEIITQAVPEPGTWAVGALLFGGAAFAHWRRRRMVDEPLAS